jgi:hypothetical protein
MIKRKPAAGNVVPVGGKPLEVSGVPGKRSYKLR